MGKWARLTPPSTPCSAARGLSSWRATPHSQTPPLWLEVHLAGGLTAQGPADSTNPCVPLLSELRRVRAPHLPQHAPDPWSLEPGAEHMVPGKDVSQV